MYSVNMLDNIEEKSESIKLARLPDYLGYQIRQAQTSVFRDIERIGDHTPPNEDGEGGFNADIYPEIYNPELMTDNKYQELKRERNTLTRRVKPAGVYPFFGFDMGFTF